MLERADAREIGRRGGGAPEGMSGAGDDKRLVELWLFGKSEKTKDAYVADYGKLALFLGGKPLRSVTLSDLQEFADDVSVLGDAYRARVLAAVKSLFSFGHQTGYLPFDVGRAVKIPPRRDALAERILSHDEVVDTISAAKKGRDRTLLRSLYIGGLRVEEAVSLTAGDLVAREEAGGGQLTLFGKGRKTRRVLLPGRLFAELSSLALPQTGSPLFRSRKRSPDGGPRPITARQAERIVKQAAREAGLKNASFVSPHWLRHAHASHAMDRGAKIHLVQATLGHSDISTTGRYLHARPDESSALYLGS